MSTNAVGGTDWSALGLTRPVEQAAKKDLGQEDFLALMIAQFKNQDPTKPVDNAQFIAQLASFGTVSGIKEMNDSMEALAGSYASGQALQASSLLGREVLVASPRGALPAGGTLDGAVDLPASAGGVRLQVVDRAGAVVRTLELGAQPAGLARFSWDGRTDAGAAAAAGNYTLRAQAYLGGGQSESVGTLVEAPVESVTLGGAAGTTINVRGLGTIEIAAVRQIS